MAESSRDAPAKQEKSGEAPRPLEPVDNLRREMDRAFSAFRRNFWGSAFGRSMMDMEPFWRREGSWSMTPAVDIVDKGSHFEVHAELPGMDAEDIDVNFADGTLTIKGEKKDEKEEKKEDYYLSERRHGSFQRSFVVPQGVDPDKIDASFKNGVLTVTLAKRPEATQNAKKIDIKAG